MAVMVAEVDYLFPKVDRYALGGGDVLVQIPWDALEKILPDRAQRIDEHQAIVRAVPESEWPALVARAEPYAITRAETAAASAPEPEPPSVLMADKPWWKFW